GIPLPGQRSRRTSPPGRISPRGLLAPSPPTGYRPRRARLSNVGGAAVPAGTIPRACWRPAATPARNRRLEATCTVSAPPPPAMRWSAEMRCPQGPRHREAWRDLTPELVRPASRTPVRRPAYANGLAPFVPRYGRQRGARES